METAHSIRIDNPYFQSKQYIFLIDSLDESGELNKKSTEKVIASVKKIQGIDKTKFMTNRVIISSRPFDDGLSQILEEHRPFTKKNNEGRSIPFFITVYGFTKAQFNNWMFDTLKAVQGLDAIATSGFSKNIIDGVIGNEKIDIYQELLDNNTLSPSELRRPIFAYMIYQLIVNNVDFLAMGKVGVYLSFLNLLTKEAKHVQDTSRKFNLREEFEFRNILQSTAALWMLERQRGQQGALNKADICRVLEGKNTDESDSQILERYKDEGVTEIQFLSHSYFGENDNILHFQHQSFAEILSAEYYLKVFIKYALDEDADVEEARVKLVLGEPTEQTLLFLKELLHLLRDTAQNQTTDKIIEKRKLLFPLMASLATGKHNKLLCNDISYGWYRNCQIQDGQSEYPIESLENWCIDRDRLNKIIKLSASILNSKNNYLLSNADHESTLYNKEVLIFRNQKIGNLTPDIDRWLALLVGNLLHNDFEKVNKPRLFNRDHKINFNHLFDLIRNWNYAYNSGCPMWGASLFKGIDMSTNNERIDMSGKYLRGMDFSYSHFKGINFFYSILRESNLSYMSFDNVDLNFSNLSNCNFDDIIHAKGLSLYYSIPLYGAILPKELANKIKSYNLGNHVPAFIPYSLDEEFRESEYYRSYFQTIRGFLVYGLQSSKFKLAEIKKWFTFFDKKVQPKFHELIDGLKEYEASKKKKKVTTKPNTASRTKK